MMDSILISGTPVVVKIHINFFCVVGAGFRKNSVEFHLVFYLDKLNKLVFILSVIISNFHNNMSKTLMRVLYLKLLNT